MLSLQVNTFQDIDLNSSLNGVMNFQARRDSDGHITDFWLVMINAPALEVWGLSQPELVGKSINQLVSETDATYLISLFGLVVSSGRAVQFTMSFTNQRDGALRDYELLVIKLNDGVLVNYDALTTRKQQQQERDDQGPLAEPVINSPVVGVMALATDNPPTDTPAIHALNAPEPEKTGTLKEAEQALQQQNDLLEQIMNLTPTAIVLSKSIRNEAGEIVDFRMTKLNQMAADVLQNPIEKIQHRRISAYIPGSRDTFLFAQCIEVVQTGKAVRLEVPWASNWYDFSIVRFGDGMVVAVQDITQMQKYRQELELTNLELKHSNENLRSFAFVASHDLQEPLRKIATFSSILITQQYAQQFDPTVNDIVRRINTAAERMSLLIKDILAYSQIETRQESLVVVNLSQLIGELKEHELWTAINQSKAKLTSSELPSILANPLQIRQLFQNLLSNAIKFSLKEIQPIITVSSRLLTRAEIPTGLIPASPTGKTKVVNNDFYEIAVSDNGIGFDEKNLNRIFQLFQRLNGRNQYDGFGIGLAICHKIAERHGGAITASSQPGQGSTFRVYLPVR